jgi:4-amino-4-deoxy-L-arabinose transferase-like glycosyltransferase
MQEPMKEAQESRIQSWLALLESGRRPAIWILVLGAAVRAIASSRTDPVAFDSAIYFEMARFIRVGAWEKALAYPFPPLFPLLVAGLEKLGIATEAAGLFWCFGLNLAVLLPLFFIARDLAGPRAALGAMFLWAVHPYAVRLSIRALSDTPTLFLVAVSLWAGLHALKVKKLSWALLAGMLSGFGYLTRPEGIEAALGLAVLYALVATPNTPSSGRARLILFRTTWLAVPLLGWALVASPYVAYISSQAGSLTLSKKKSVQTMVSSFSVPASKPDQALSPPAEKTPASEPSAVIAQPRADAQPGWLWRAARSIYIFQQPLVNGVYPVVLFFAVWGIIEIRRGRVAVQRSAFILLAGLAGLHFLILVGVAADQGPEYLGGHHFFLLVLYVLPFAGAGLSAAIDQARARFAELRWASAMVITICAILMVPPSIRSRDYRGSAQRHAGLWVRNHLTQDSVIVSNSAKFAFHAGLPRMQLSEVSKAELDSARQRGARFVGLYSDSSHAHELQALIRSGEVEVAAEFPERERRFQIYRISPKG